MNKNETQNRTLEQHLRCYTDGIYPLHMPGHKRMEGSLPTSIADIDVTEVEGTDNLYRPEGIVGKSLDHAASFYGTRKTYFLLNGSTGGILSAVAAMGRPGEKVLVMRNCHQSVYHALELNRLEPVFLYPQEAAEGLAGGVSLEDVKKAYRDNPDMKGCIITSPTYEGLVLPVYEIAGAVHADGGWLIVDEAHGAHFNYSDLFPKSALASGADIVIQSLHKTMPSMTQTALMHVAGEWVDLERLDHYYEVYQTSSPSYVMMASIDNCIRKYEHAPEVWTAFEKILDAVDKRLQNMKRLKLTRERELDMTHLAGLDRSKVLVSTLSADITGLELERRLREDWGFQVELSNEVYILAMLTVADKAAEIRAFLEALIAIDKELEPAAAPLKRTAENRCNHPKPGCTMEEAWLAEGTWMPLEKCCGRIVQLPVTPYPPGIPFLAAGEIIEEGHIEWLLSAVEAGRVIKGLKLEGQQIDIKILK